MFVPFVSDTNGIYGGRFVAIKRSQQNNGDSGRGVFAKKEFRKDDFITFVDGTINSSRSSLQYSMILGDGKYLNGIDKVQKNCGLGSFINRVDKNQDPNVCFTQIGSKVFVQALRRIVIGQELVVRYGKSYKINSARDNHSWR